VQDCDFCEHHPGEGDGLTYEEFDRRWPVPEHWRADTRRDPGGETWAEMAARVARGLDAVVARHPGATVVVVCHGGVIVHSLIRWLQLVPFEDGDGDGARRAWLDPANTSLTEWRFGSDPYGFLGGRAPLSLVRFNDHAHLMAGAGL
jgi:probable phosphoglycerate mutase